MMPRVHRHEAAGQAVRQYDLVEAGFSEEAGDILGRDGVAAPEDGPQPSGGRAAIVPAPASESSRSFIPCMRGEDFPSSIATAPADITPCACRMRSSV